MFVLMAAFIFALSFQAQAQSFKVRWVCATEPLTTSYALIENQDNYELQVMHHNGVAYMPVYKGLITPSDLHEIARRGEIFKKLGSRYTVFFKKSECETSQNEWLCVRHEPLKIGGLKIDNLQVRLQNLHVITHYIDDKGHSLNFSLFINGESLDIPMEYSESACVFH